MWLSSCDFLFLLSLHCMWLAVCGILFSMLLHYMQLVPCGILFLLLILCMRLAPCRINLLLFLHYTWLLPNGFLLLLHVASTLRHLVFAVFTLRLTLTLHNTFPALCSTHWDSHYAGSLSCCFYIASALHLEKSFYCCFSIACVLLVTKPCFLLVKYYILLTRRSLMDSWSTVFKLHVAGTMQNITFALFTLHVAHNLSSFYTILRLYAALPLLSLNCMWLKPCKILSLLFCSLHVA